MASQKRTMLKKVAELRLRGADLVDRTFSAMPPAFVVADEKGLPQGSDLAQQWEKTLISVRTGWGELDCLAEMLRERVDGMPLPGPLPWKQREIVAAGDDTDEVTSTLESRGGLCGVMIRLPITTRPPLKKGFYMTTQEVLPEAPPAVEILRRIGHRLSKLEARLLRKQERYRLCITASHAGDTDVIESEIEQLEDEIPLAARFVG